MKAVICIILIIAVIYNVCTIAQATELDEDSITSRGAIVIEFETGTVLFEKNADAQINAASMNKMMSVYLVYEAITRGDFGFDTIVPISQAAEEFSRGAETNVPLSRSAEYTVDQLLDAVMVVSAGGATLALAELVAGSRADFIELMNEKAAEWEIEALFDSPSGGPLGSFITPRAMATITRNTILDFPEVLEKTSIRSITFANHQYPSTNKLLGEYDGIDGFKTGTNSASGECFAGTAKQGDVRIITVTMGSAHNTRFLDTKKMLDFGFEKIKEMKEQGLLDTPTPPVETSPPVTEEPPETTQPPVSDQPPETETPPVSEPPLIDTTPTIDPTLPTAPAQTAPPSEQQPNGDDGAFSQVRVMTIVLITGVYAVFCIAFYLGYRYVKKRKNRR